MLFKIIGYLIVLSLIACILLAMKKHALLKSAEQCRGIVTKHIARSGRKGRTSYALEIEYRDGTGTAKQFVTRGSSSPASRAIGDEVVVFEHAEGSPPDVLIFEDLFFGYWLWFCAGFTVAGCLAAPTLLRLLYLK